jgi:hypothetical protein
MILRASPSVSLNYHVNFMLNISIMRKHKISSPRHLVISDLEYFVRNLYVHLLSICIQKFVNLDIGNKY